MHAYNCCSESIKSLQLLCEVVWRTGAGMDGLFWVDKVGDCQKLYFAMISCFAMRQRATKLFLPPLHLSNMQGHPGVCGHWRRADRGADYGLGLLSGLWDRARWLRVKPGVHAHSLVPATGCCSASTHLFMWGLSTCSAGPGSPHIWLPYKTAFPAPKPLDFYKQNIN